MPSPPVSKQTGRRYGDVLRYTAAQNHCREGLAFVNERGVARDTYWQPNGDSDSHSLTEQEWATATVIFNVEDYDALDRYSATSREAWVTYHPDDRARITSQHGLQEALFIRRGAEPNLGTQVENARAAIERAEADLGSAQREVERRRRNLADLEGSAARVS